MTKARTRSQKRRGRKKLPMQEREPNGRLSRRAEAVSWRDREAAAEVRRVAKDARLRVHGVSEAHCECTEAGYVLGRLYLAGYLGPIAKKGKKTGRAEALLEAGNRLAQDYARYYGLTGIPYPSARAQDLFRIRGMPGAYRHEATVSASNKMMALEKCLGLADKEGRPVTTVVKRVCIEDSDEGVLHGFMLAHLRRGLYALVEHYGIALDDARKSA